MTSDVDADKTPQAPEYPFRVHIFDARATDRVSGVFVARTGETWRDAKAKISDRDGTPPAFEGATKTEDGWEDADLSKGLTATLDPDDDVGLQYLGTLQESASELQSRLDAMDNPMKEFALSCGEKMNHDQQQKMVAWMRRLLADVQEVED